MKMYNMIMDNDPEIKNITLTHNHRPITGKCFGTFLKMLNPLLDINVKR